MSRDDDDAKPRSEDPDRAAILARRQHFIALALTGLAATACASTSTDTGDKSDEAGKGPRPEAPPEPCLKVAVPSDDETTGTTSSTSTGEPAEGGSETGGEETGGETGMETPPQVCLKVAPARPCLKKAAPRPCLNVAPTD